MTDLFGSRSVAAMQDRLADLCAAEGLPFAPRTHTYNSRLAQELALWAVEAHGNSAIHDALFRMYFERGRNLGAVDVLLETADLAGLPVRAAEAVLTERLWSPRVDDHWDRSRRLGVTAVPTYRTGAGSVVGAQPYAVLEELLRWEEER